MIKLRIGSVKDYDDSNVTIYEVEYYQDCTETWEPVDVEGPMGITSDVVFYEHDGVAIQPGIYLYTTCRAEYEYERVSSMVELVNRLLDFVKIEKL